MSRLTEQQPQRFYQLELQSGIVYKIKVKFIFNNKEEQKLYYRSKGYNTVWVLFATCNYNDDLEKTIRVHFGSKGKLIAIKE